MIDPGQLKTRLVIQQPVETPDDQGGVTRTCRHIRRHDKSGGCCFGEFVGGGGWIRSCQFGRQGRGKR